MIPEDFNLDYIWQFRFENYSDAASIRDSYNRFVLSQSRQEGFDSNEWLNKQKSMLGLAANGVLPRVTSIIEFLESASIENIIDFGGGPGWIWAYLVKANLHGNLKYYNVELESSRLAFEYPSEQLPRMDFTTIQDISHLILDRNVLYSNSVLQYFENNSILISLIQASNPVSIILDDIAGSNEEFFSLQNYYGHMQINRFLDLEKLIFEVCIQGYRLSSYSPYHKEFSRSMIPKIWLGDKKGGECRIPSSVSLIFDRV